MSTAAKAEANRKNAQLSTGPLTAEGKATSAKNATKHGLLSHATLLAGESRAAFDGFSAGLLAALQPSGDVQRMLADHVVACAWRLRRLFTVEAAIVEYEQESVAEINTTPYARLGLPSTPRSTPHATVALGFMRGAKHLETLSKYEAQIERSLRRSLADLRELQSGGACYVVDVAGEVGAHDA